MIIAHEIAKAIQEAEERGFKNGYSEASKKDAETLEKAATETRKLIGENINLTLKNQKACELLTGQCALCPADGVTCHRDAKDHECWNRVDMSLEKMVKGEVIT